MTNTITKEEIIKQLIEKKAESIGLSNDRDEPIYILDFIGDAYLKINSDWINDNYDVYEDFLVDYIRQYTENKISFNQGSLLSERIIDAICANDNIKEVSIAAGVKEDGYTLTNEDYKKFKESKKKEVITTNVANDLSETFDPIISYNYHRKLIGNKAYPDLQNGELIIDFVLNPEELDNLKYLSDKTVLKITAKSNLLKISAKLKELNKNNKIITSVTYDRRNEELASMGFFDENWNVIEEASDNMYVSDNLKLSTYLRCESILYMIAREAEHLSPVEKYIYVYDIVKHFKEYNTPGKDNKSVNDLPEEEALEIKMRSRNLYEILDNDYIVCVGFTALQVNLLHKLGIDACQDSINVEVSDHKAISQLKNKYENWNELSDLEKNNLIMQQKTFIPQNSFEGHSRIIVKLDDPKYGIKGLYFADPTWDNNIEKNSYAHAFMTAETVLKSKSSLQFDFRDVFLYASNLEQFKEMFSVGLKKYIENSRLETYEKYKEIRNYKSVNDVPVNIKSSITSYIRTVCLGSIQYLFNDEYRNLIEKYPFIMQFDANKWPFQSDTELGPEINNLLNDFGNFILSINNNTISKDTLTNIIKEVYRGIFYEPLSNETIKEYNENPMDIGLNDKVYLSEVKQELIDEFIKDTNDIEEYEFGEKRTK